MFNVYLPLPLPARFESTMSDSQRLPSASGVDAGLHPTDQPVTAPGQNSAARIVARYQVGEKNDAQLHAVRDRLLDRQATGRVVSLAMADDLEVEARFLARLDHLATPDVLDFVRDDRGAMLIMRRLDGQTLDEAIESARSGGFLPGLASPTAVVMTMLKVCDAVSAAHAQGVVHHDLKPASILLGGHGQVVVQDWSAAMAEKQHPATLRYVSTAPSAESLALDGLHQDIRALGACLFAALVLRAPQPDGTDVLGYIQPEERVRLPVELEAIIRRALASDPSSGYRSMSHVAQDLMCFVDGVHPVAYVPGVMDRIYAQVRRRRTSLLTCALIAAFALTTVAFLWGRELHDWASWHIVAAEDFSDAGWRKRWMEPPSPHGMFAIQEGRLVSTAERDACLIFRRRVSTPVAIEYTGEMLAGTQPCDLSVQWSEDSGVAENPERFAKDGRSYMIQAGAYGNSFCAIYRNPGHHLMGHANLQLETGRRYRFRVELDGKRVSLCLDGKQVVEGFDDVPTRSGFVALYAFYAGKAFDDVRILQRYPANQPTALDAGDVALLARHYEQAAGLYARVSEMPVSLDEAQEAIFRKGLAEWYLSDSSISTATWEAVSDPRLVRRIASLRLESFFKSDQLKPHVSWLEDQYRGHPDDREVLRRDWREIVQQQCDAPVRNLTAIDALLDVRKRVFPEDESSRFVAATILVRLERFADVLAEFPEQRSLCARSMQALGMSEALLQATWAGNDERAHALGMRGEFSRQLESPGLMPYWRRYALIRMDRLDESLLVEDSSYPSLLHMGRGMELLDKPGTSPSQVNAALVSLGRLREAAGDGLPQVPGSGSSVAAMLLLGQLDMAERIAKRPFPAIRFMQAVERGDADGYTAYHDLMRLPVDLSYPASWFAVLAMRPFVDAMRGDVAALDQQLRPQLPLLDGVFHRSAWFVARALLGAAPPDSVAQMPCRYDAPAWQLVATGMRAELTGQGAEALRSYGAFKSMPMYRRLLDQHQPDVDVEWFVSWRLRVLQGAPTAP
jgi:hypothetical protein